MSGPAEQDQAAQKQSVDVHVDAPKPAEAAQPKVAGLHKPTNGHDSSPKGHSDKPPNGNHSASPKTSAEAETKAGAAPESSVTPMGVLDRVMDTVFPAAPKPGEPTANSLEILSNVAAAEMDLSLLETISSDLLVKAQNKKVAVAEVLQSAERLKAPLALATQHLGLAQHIAGRELLDRSQSQHKPMTQVIQELGAEPALQEIIQRVSLSLGRCLANMDGAADARAEVRPFLQGDAGMIVHNLRNVRANVGLRPMGHDELVGHVELKVSVAVTDLGTGTPRDQIQEAVTTMALAWNLSVSNFSVGVRNLINTVSHDEFKKAKPGLMTAIFDQGKKLIMRAAEFVTGSNVGAKLGFMAIEKLHAYHEALEQSRVRADKQTFIAQLQRAESALSLQGLAEGGNLDVGHSVSALDAEFKKIGLDNPDDAHKWGDSVVVGAQASFLNDLKSRAKDCRAGVPSDDEFTTRFLVEWINASHKERDTPWLRSPFEGSAKMDGYVAVDLKLDYSSAAGFFIWEPGAASLHCPNSGSVAAQLKGSTPDFDVSKLDTNVHVNIELTKAAQEFVPNGMDQDWHEWHVHLAPGQMSTDTESTKRKWNWMQQTLGTSTAKILARVRDLKG